MRITYNAQCACVRELMVALKRADGCEELFPRSPLELRQTSETSWAPTLQCRWSARGRVRSLRLRSPVALFEDLHLDAFLYGRRLWSLVIAVRLPTPLHGLCGGLRPTLYTAVHSVCSSKRYSSKRRDWSRQKGEVRLRTRMSQVVRISFGGRYSRDGERSSRMSLHLSSACKLSLGEEYAASLYGSLADSLLYGYSYRSL